MPTQSQIDANRRNSKKSTGPRTEAGKARARMNALKYGIDAKTLIFPGEDPAEFAELRQALIEEHQPATPNQVAYVDIIAAAIWKWRRFQRAEQQQFTADHLRQKQFDWYNPAFPLNYPSLAGDTFEKLRRAAEAEVRTLNRALDQLRRLKHDEAAAEEAAPVLDAAEPEAPAAHAESPERTHFSPPAPPPAPTLPPDPIPPDSETGPKSPERRIA